MGLIDLHGPPQFHSRCGIPSGNGLSAWRDAPPTTRAPQCEQYQTHESAAVTTFRARGSFPIVSENEDYEKKIAKERILHAEFVNAVILQTDEAFHSCECAWPVAQTCKCKATQSKYLEQWVENHRQELEDGGGEHWIAVGLLRSLPASLRRPRRPSDNKGDAAKTKIHFLWGAYQDGGYFGPHLLVLPPVFLVPVRLDPNDLSIAFHNDSPSRLRDGDSNQPQTASPTDSQQLRYKPLPQCPAS